MTTPTIKIAKHFNTLLEAVEAAGLDLSYNKADAIRSIKFFQSGYKGALKILTAFTTETNEVWTIVQVTEDGLKIASRYEPFHRCLDDSKLGIYAAHGANGEELSGGWVLAPHLIAELRFQDINIPKTPAARKAFGATCLIAA